jgi:hypothetical protein
MIDYTRDCLKEQLSSSSLHLPGERVSPVGVPLYLKVSLHRPSC